MSLQQRLKSKVFECMEQINKLMKQNKELQSKIRDTEQLKSQEKVEKESEMSKLYETIKRLQKETQEQGNTIQQLRQVNAKSEYECKELEIQKNKLQQDYEELRTNQMVMDESKYLSWNSKDVGRWVLSLNKNCKKYEQELMNMNK
eukprot:862863_1